MHNKHGRFENHNRLAKIYEALHAWVLYEDDKDITNHIHRIDVVNSIYNQNTSMM